MQTIEERAVSILLAQQRDCTTIREAARAIIPLVLEEAAKCAEDYPTNDYPIGVAMNSIAAAIRALAEPWK